MASFRDHITMSGFNVVVSSDDGKWWVATPLQEQAYRAWYRTPQEEIVKVYVGDKSNNVWFNMREKSDSGVTGPWIQDRSRHGSWRKIKDISD
jgi:hypothetical protein